VQNMLVVGWHWITRPGSSPGISCSDSCNWLCRDLPYGHTLCR
jgi:hypothetical protein